MPAKEPVLHAEASEDALVSGVEVIATVTGAEARVLADALQLQAPVAY